MGRTSPGQAPGVKATRPRDSELLVVMASSLALSVRISQDLGVMKSACALTNVKVASKGKKHFVVDLYIRSLLSCCS